METKEVMDGKKPSTSPEVSGTPKVGIRHQTWEERRVSVSEFIERLDRGSLNRGHSAAQRELTSSEFLELLARQEPEGRFHSAPGVDADGNYQGSSSKNQSTHKDKKQEYQTVAIDQCNITSSVDYGSRDYYYPSTHTSDAPYNRKEKEFDELYNTVPDTRGNWWEGSFYY